MTKRKFFENTQIHSPADEYTIDQIELFIDLFKTDLLSANYRDAEARFQEWFPQRETIALHKRILEWIDGLKETSFYTDYCDKELHIVTKRDKGNRRVILNRLQKEGVIFPDKIAGKYKIAQGRGKRMDWLNADDTPLDMVFPLGEEKLVEIYPKNTLLYAGSWQSGKTAYFFNIAWMNRNKFNSINYFMSELGKHEVKKRLKKGNQFDLVEYDERIDFIEQSSHFDEGLDPDGLNLIDYLSVKDNFHEVAGIIETIDDALKTGVAVIAIQKPGQRDYGYGGEMTGNRPRLYVALERGIAKILKGKNWREDRSPDGLVRQYKIFNGIKFEPIDEWREDYGQARGGYS